ncbi:ATP-binding protein [Dactylosporangium salmoneum]|uniref:Orc1-like AAA ATPase domain-containing protein n=1 Tax=Dactylosporangium salmoneum TaxID=53361 RepID=A0ABN3GTS0_9ACTN
MDPASSAAALPAPLTTLVGRESLVRAVRRLLDGGGPRLVSLVGPAGCGKTRVAIAAAATAARPVRFVDLSTMDDQSPAGFVLDALGVTRRPDLSELDTLVAALTPAPADPEEHTAAGLPRQVRPGTAGRGELLLVLDNCEHVAAGVAGLVEGLLAVHPGLSLLVTSRQALGLADETVVGVEPLDKDTALRLFETRMFERTGRPLPAAHLPAAAAICAALDGLPLAVELAAARAALLSVPEVRRLLADRFRVLADAKAAGPEHHRTLRAALDWSYHLLSPDKQALLRQLAVFHGGWSEAAVSSLPAYRPGLLDALAERSLLAGALGARPVTAPTDRYRGRLLQTVAAYAAARLAEHPGEAAAALDAHAAHYLDLAERAAAGIRGPGQRDWLRTLILEQDNLRAALARLATRPGRAADADLRMAAAMAPFQHFTGGYSQGRHWLAEALERRPDAPAPARVAASCAAATLAMLACDYPAAAALARAALPLTGADPAARGRLLTLLGGVERERARYAESMTHLDEARRLYRDSGDAWGEGHATQLAGKTAWLSGDLDAAADLLTRSLAAFRDLADAESAASCLTHLGAVAHYRGDQPAARRHLLDALDRFTELAFPEGVAWAQDLLGRTDLADDRLPSAAERLRASLALHRSVGDRWRTASVLEALAECRRLGGDPAHAAALLGAADLVRREIAAPTPACELPSRRSTDAALRAALPAPDYDRAYRFGARTALDDLLPLTGATLTATTPATVAAG